MVQLIPHRGVALGAVWAEVLARLPLDWPRVPLSPALTAAIGIDPTAAVLVSLPLSTGRVALLTLLRNSNWIELVSVLRGDDDADPLTDQERTEAAVAWVEAGVRTLRGVEVRPDALAPAEAAARRLTASLGLHHSDLAVLLRGPDRAVVLHPVAGRTSMDYGDPSPRVPETLAALETLVLPAAPEAAAAALSAAADAHRRRAPGSPPERITGAEDAAAFLEDLSGTQRSFDKAAALEVFQAVGPGPWFLARRRHAESAVQVVAVRPTLAVVLDLQGDGP